jgi:nitronate monooxygenase
MLPFLEIGNSTARIPIIQGGMGIGVSLSGLASAVAAEGGIGVIATAGIGMKEPGYASDYTGASIRALQNEIRKAKQMTSGVLGVNIMVALSNFADMVKTAIEEEIDIIFSGAGLPLNLPEYLNETSRTKLVPIVSSARSAGIICKRWYERYNYLPDAIVVEGPKAGGHLGFKPEDINNPDFALELLIPEVIAEVSTFEAKANKKIPVIAAGGVYTGKDIRKYISMGASGVQMATRFVTTIECDASRSFKQTYIDSNKEDIGIIKSPVGLPGRAIMNAFIDEINSGSKKPFKCPYHCIKTCDYTNTPYCIALALLNAKKGNFDHGFAFAGSNAYRAKELVSVKDLIKSLIEEYKASFNDFLKTKVIPKLCI